MSARGARLRAGLVLLRRTALGAAVVAMALGVGNRETAAAQHVPELDVLVAIDRTTSMSALDHPAGSRIAGARGDLVELGDLLDRARFSVVTFGRTATVVLPFTSDRLAYEDAVGSVQVERADAGSGSSVGRPVALLEQELDDAADSEEVRVPVVVLVTDGENTAPGPHPSYAGVGARTDTAVVLGYGTEEGGVMPIKRVPVGKDPVPPERAGPLVPDPATGEPARSRLDADNLAGIATELGGTLVRADGTQDLPALAADLQAAAYAGLSPGEAERELRWAWALLVLGLVLPELRTGWRRQLEARREARA